MKAKTVWKFCIVMQVACLLGWIGGVYLMMQERTVDWELKYMLIPLIVYVFFNAGAWIARSYTLKGEAPPDKKEEKALTDCVSNPKQ